MTESQRSKFLVCHDYGQGGAWAYVHASSEAEVKTRFPGLTVIDTSESGTPGWITDETHILETDLEAPSGWLKVYAEIYT